MSDNPTADSVVSDSHSLTLRLSLNHQIGGREVIYASESESSHKRYVIDPSKPWHLTWWAHELGVSEAGLVGAVLRVGFEADTVEAFLKGRYADEPY